MTEGPNHRATIGALVVVTLVLVFGIWVFNRLDQTQKAQECAERRGARCATIDPTTLPAR